MENARFYIEQISFCTQIDSKLDFIPMLLRRKLSKLDKLALSSIEKVYDNNIEEFVFSSQYGEWERLFSIIEQYTESNEVSPISFSASVHNYLAGIISLVKHSTIPYYSISAGENSLSSGLIKSIISKKRVLYCYADNFGKAQSVAMIISPTYKTGSICAEFRRVHSGSETDEYDSFQQFINGKIPCLKTNIGEFYVIGD